ncbi:hypothetical protein [Aliarcobacter butzleri]|uniref:hypothetical protein n=1 Tax=Aliarcobacter butzleri TaxID=28197 RepID=UPI001260DC2D|nr:hypothetical protein [Aliarcobacter butzleri]
MNKIIILSILVCNIYANSITAFKGLAGSLDPKNILKTKPLASITQKDLSLCTKTENIQNLQENALNSNRLKYSEIGNNIKKFNSMDKGDILFLKCLKEKECNLETFAINLERSDLHRQIAIKNPSVNIGRLNKVIGNLNENLMNKYFISSKWTKIEGEVGNNGIDGLFIKRNQDGIIKEVLFVESKYNKSGLIKTNFGEQMSKEWLLKKVDNLKQKHPNNTDYIAIEKYINNGSYRSLLWNLKVENNHLIFDVSKLQDKSGKILKERLTGGEKLKINQQDNGNIDLKNPKNSFQENMSSIFKEELKGIEI